MTYQPVVTLWHTNPDLAQTVDTLAGHGGRAARIILKLWPDSSVALLHWALGAKVIHEQERAALDRIWPGLPELTPDEYEALGVAVAL